MRLAAGLLILGLWSGSVCAAPPTGPKAESLFLSPMGEPFRAPADQPYPSRTWFERADANHDGKITREEFIADAMRFYDRLDEERWGYIDDDVIQGYETVLVPELAHMKLEADSEPEPLAVGAGHRSGSAEAALDSLPRSTTSMPSHGGEPTGQINLSRRKDLRPEGAAWYGWLPYAEPLSSIRTYYGQRITKQLFEQTAGARFDLLAGQAGVLKYEDLPKTPSQSAPARRR